MHNTYKLQKLISRYAKAYCAVYKDQIVFKERNAIVDISKLLEKTRFFLILINNTLKDYTDLKVSIIADYFKMHNLDLPFEKLIKLLLTHNRLTLLPQILKQIAMFYDTEHNITQFQITTPSLISENFKTEISSFLSSITKKTVLPHYSIDPSLIAGFRAQSKEFLYENSLRKKLQTLTHLID
jgi:F0F1-type ATP synthase delta subunit